MKGFRQRRAERLGTSTEVKEIKNQKKPLKPNNYDK